MHTLSILCYETHCILRYLYFSTLFVIFEYYKTLTFGLGLIYMGQATDKKSTSKIVLL